MSFTISREHRALIVLALDFSGSMVSQMSTTKFVRKSDMMKQIAYSLLYELLLRARRSDGVRNYYDVGIICYSDDKVLSAFDDRWYLPISSIANFAQQNQRGDLLIERLEQFTTHGSTPMLGMLLRVEQILKEWTEKEENRESIAPIFINITDGMATDATEEILIGTAERISQIATKRGRVMILQNHLSTSGEMKPIIFPHSIDELKADRYAKMLYRMSSDIPVDLEGEIHSQLGIKRKGAHKLMAYNCSPSDIISLLSIGTSAIRRE